MAKINFSDVLPKVEYNGLKKFKIDIRGLYGWGDGYYNETAIRVFKSIKEVIKDNLSELFSKAVIYIDHDNGCSCDEIVGKNKLIHSYVYLHPMEFTGYLPEKDIDKLCDFLNHLNGNAIMCGYTIRASISFIYNSVRMSDSEYADLICEHSKEIIEKVKAYYNTLKTAEKKELFKKTARQSVGFDFAETARIPRENDGPGMCSNNIDILTVNNIVKIAIDNGLLD